MPIESLLSKKKNIRSIFREEQMDYETKCDVCVGQNQELEKEYLRLTGPPEPHMIRPEHVLKKSLVFVLNKYAETSNYRYICEQLKSIRQDLTVQMIQNEFTIQVYETHARIAIKNKDRDEFNQCQSQLKSLYELVQANGNQEMYENSAEFIGYRLLYNMLTKSHTDLNQVIKEIKLKYSGHSYLEHLLALRSAWHLNNYVKFFRLYATSNEMSKCLIDLFIERERKLALKIIIKSYRPSIKLEHVREMLAYETVQMCRDDLVKYKLNIQSVPVVSGSGGGGDSSDAGTKLTATASYSSSVELQSKSNHNNNNKCIRTTITNSVSKSYTLNPKLNSSDTLYEDVLDCKSCTLQGF